MSTEPYPVLTPDRLPGVLALAAASRRALFLHGAAGVGKSAVILAAGSAPALRKVAWSQWAEGTGRSRPEVLPDLQVIHLTIPQMEAEDFTGVPWHRRVSAEGLPEDRATSWAPVDFLRHPEPVVLFLDEVNAAELRVQKVLLQIVQERKVFNVALAPGTVVVLAGNRAQDRAALKTVPFPLGNRCAHYAFEPTAEAWLAWAEREGLPEGILAFVAQHREAGLFAYDPDDPSLAQLTPRSLEAAARAVMAVAELELADRESEDAVLANLGQAQGLKLLAFLRLRHELPRWEDVLANPQAAQLPPRGLVDRVYAVAALVLEGLGREGLAEADLEAGLAYVDRLAEERPEAMDALIWLASELLRRHPVTTETGARLFNALAALPVLGPKAASFLSGIGR